MGSLHGAAWGKQGEVEGVCSCLAPAGGVRGGVQGQGLAHRRGQISFCHFGAWTQPPPPEDVVFLHLLPGAAHFLLRWLLLLTEGGRP